MIDTQGYRANIGIILTNQERQVLWTKRVGQNAWQFPQGGMKPSEAPREAMFRELYEELGLRARQVHVVGNTKGWLRYRLPENLVRYHQRPLCIGQKQVWFMLRLLCKESEIRFDAKGIPEFEAYKWVDYWQPLQEVIYFKRKVYEQALSELSCLAGRPTKPAHLVTSDVIGEPAELMTENSHHTVIDPHKLRR
jgi:putative (di)nucleoside polyphosphate hydrolase